MFELGLLLPLTFILGSISWRFILGTLYIPRVRSKELDIFDVLKPLVAIHCFRYMSMSLLIPGLTTAYSILPTTHIYRLAFGDIGASLLAMLTLFSLHREWKIWRIIIIVFSVWGLADLGLATLFDMPLLVDNVNKLDTRLFGVLTTFIPLVFVSHVFIVKLLWDYRTEIYAEKKEEIHPDL